MMSYHDKGKIVRLNVGGMRYDVSRSTLERCEGSMLISLISEHWKEGNSDEPIFIDRNGRLFEYVLDYLRTAKVYLPATVSPLALEEEFEFYGIEADMTKVQCMDASMGSLNALYESHYLLGLADQISAEAYTTAARRAVEKSLRKSDIAPKPSREIPFFILVECYKRNPTPGASFCVYIPEEYQPHLDTDLVNNILTNRGFEIVNSAFKHFLYIKKVSEG
jgi:hypothetical protein